MNINRSIPLKYIAFHSKAHFKIGRYFESSAFIYDMMISVTETNNLDEYIYQTLHYLNNLSNENK